MFSDVNVLAVLAAAVATMALGAIWYGPLFGRQWMSAHGYTPERLAEMKQGMGKAYGLSFVCYLVMATVLSILIARAGDGGVAGGLSIAAYCWVGFAATVGLTSYLFSDRKVASYLLDAGYQLAYMLAMGAILGAWT